MSRRKTEEEIEKRAEGGNTDEASQGESSPTGNPSKSSAYDALLNAASQISATLATGATLTDTQLTVSDDARTNLQQRRTYDTIPGVMVIDWLPSYGVVRTRDDTACLAVGEVASFIKSKINGNRTWENGDLLVYMAAVDSIYSLHYDLIRLYGIINSYSPLNKYYPRAIVAAMGYDFDDIMDNQEKLWFYINQRSSELARYAMPATFDLFKQHMRYNSVVFTDGGSAKSQMYVFRQAGFYSYEKVDEVKGLSVVGFTGDGSLPRKRFSDIKELYGSMLDALRDSADVDRIKADIINAYGDAAIKIAPKIDVSYTTPVVKDDLMLTTINNIQFAPVDPLTNRVEDKGGNLFSCRPAVVRTSYSNVNNPISTLCYGNINQLNFVSDTPNPEEVAAAMRMHPVIDINTLTVEDVYDSDLEVQWKMSSYELLYCGTEIPICGHIISLVPRVSGYQGYMSSWASARTADGGISYVYTDAFDSSTIIDEDMEYRVYTFTNSIPDAKYFDTPVGAFRAPEMCYQTLAALSCFDWHMPVCVANTIADIHTGSTLYVSGGITMPDGGIIRLRSDWIYDVQNVAQVETDTMGQIYTAMLYSSFFN